MDASSLCRFYFLRRKVANPAVLKSRRQRAEGSGTARTNWMVLSPLGSDKTVVGVVLKKVLPPTNAVLSRSVIELALKTITLFANESASKTDCP